MKWAFMATLAVLPLQWYVIGNTPFGVGRLHQLGILLFATVLFLRYKPTAAWPLRNAIGPFFVANMYMLTIWSAIQLYHGQLPLGSGQEYLYLGVYLAVGLFVFRAAMGREPGAIELLRWAAALTSVTFVIALSYSMVRNGVNPANALAQTISTGNPEILQKQIFKTAFVGFGYDSATVRGNIRHEIFGAILCAMYISAWAVKYRPFKTSSKHLLYQASMLFGGILLVSSLSRSIIISAAVWPLLSLVRSIRSFTLTARQVALTYVFLGLTALLTAAGATLVLWNRFTTDTSSYQARTSLYGQALGSLQSSFLLGGVNTTGSSSHNFVLDALLRGGIFVAIPAAFIVLSILWTFLRLVARFHLTADWSLPVAAALVLPLVRFGTSGGGLINPVEWVTLGFVAGVLAADRRRSSPQVREQSSDSQPVLA